MTLRSRAAGYLRDARSGIRRAPVEVLATLCVAIAFSSAVEIGGDSFRAFTEVGVAAFLMLVVAWTGTMLHAMGAWDASRRWSVTVAGVVIGGLYAAFVADFEYDAETWRAVLLCAAGVFWLIALPAFGGPREGRVERMRRIDGRILLRLIGAGLYGAALFAGLALALAAVDSLFELELDGEIYGHVFGWIAFVLVPWIVLGGLADYVRPLEQTNAVAGVAQRIVAYLVPPLLAIYYMILFAYVARIFVTGEVPKNLVSPLVLAAGGLSALSLLLFDPRPGESGLARWLRITPPLFLPIAALGFWALNQRTDQYGLTEFRVIRFAALLTLTLLAFGGVMWLVRRRAFPLHAIPLALGAAAVLGAIGPWSAIALSRRSQESRLLASLAEAGIAPDDAAYVPPPDSARRVVPTDAYIGITNGAQYLVQHFGPEALPPVLRRLAHGDERRWSEYGMLLGLRPDSVPMDMRYGRMGGFMPSNQGFAIGGGTAYRVTWQGGPASDARVGSASSPIDARETIIVNMVDSMRVSFRVSDAVLYADLGPLAERVAENFIGGRGQPGALPAIPIELTDTAGAARGQLILWSFWLEPDSVARNVGTFEGLAVIRAD